MPLSTQALDRIRGCLQEARRKDGDVLAAASDPEFMDDIEEMSDNDPDDVRDATADVLAAISEDTRQVLDLLDQLEQQNYTPVLAWFENQLEICVGARNAMQAARFTVGANTDALIDVLSQCVDDLKAQL